MRVKGRSSSSSSSKVVVYAAQAAAPPVLTYMRAPIEVLDSFTYLGVDISSRSAFAAASIGRAASAQRAALALQHRCHDLSLHDPALQLHLFDALVRPVMLYGVETWEGRKIYMYALTKPHGSCRGSSGTGGVVWERHGFM